MADQQHHHPQHDLCGAFLEPVPQPLWGRELERRGEPHRRERSRAVPGRICFNEQLRHLLSRLQRNGEQLDVH